MLGSWKITKEEESPHRSLARMFESSLKDLVRVPIKGASLLYVSLSIFREDGLIPSTAICHSGRRGDLDTPNAPSVHELAACSGSI